MLFADRGGCYLERGYLLKQTHREVETAQSPRDAADSEVRPGVVGRGALAPGRGLLGGGVFQGQCVGVGRAHSECGVLAEAQDVCLEQVLSFSEPVSLLCRK